MWKWYGVKTLYRSRAVGRPRVRSASYDGDATLVEERVVLVRARSGQEAIARAEKEAKTYTDLEHRNPYGQMVRVRYLGAADAFEMFEKPGSGVEVFSTTYLESSTVRDAQVVERLMASEPSDGRRIRTKFADGEFLCISKDS